MMKVLEGFHHRISRRIIEKTSWRFREEGWECPPTEEVLDAEGMYPIQEYVQNQQGTIAYYITTQPIYDLCTRAEQMQGPSRILKW